MSAMAMQLKAWTEDLGMRVADLQAPEHRERPYEYDEIKRHVDYTRGDIERKDIAASTIDTRIPLLGYRATHGQAAHYDRQPEADNQRDHKVGRNPEHAVGPEYG